MNQHASARHINFPHDGGGDAAIVCRYLCSNSDPKNVFVYVYVGDACRNAMFACMDFMH